jgi:hypothetical protein
VKLTLTDGGDRQAIEAMQFLDHKAAVPEPLPAGAEQLPT